jgi:hypothetical protein
LNRYSGRRGSGVPSFGLQNKRVSDATFARAEKLFGKPGVVDLTAVSGY